MLGEPQRPPLAPQPAINQNRPAPVQPRLELDDDDEGDDGRRPLSVARLLGWIVLLPWYLAILAAAIGVIALFAKGFFHL